MTTVPPDTNNVHWLPSRAPANTCKNAKKPAGLLRNLLRDSSANVLVITAAAIIPMIALAGSAIDISRLYLARNRLQAACDSGVLAGRKAMTTLTFTTAARTRAEAMFNFNFDKDDYQSTEPDFDAVADAEGKLTAEASTTLPMLVMDFLGFDDRDIVVECSADIQVPNIDVVFVLDVTGSMNDRIDGIRKIDAMKTATIAFYDSLVTAMAGNTRTRIRYGFVPYSQAVNGSELFTSNPDFEDLGQVSLSHLADTMTVQSRVANFDTEVTGSGYTAWAEDTSTAPVVFNQTFASGSAASKLPDAAASPAGTIMSSGDCDNYSNNLSFSIDNTTNLRVWFPTRTSWPDAAGIGNSVLYKPGGSNNWQATQPNSGTSYVRATFARVSSTWTDNNGATTNKYKVCTRRVTHTTFRRAPNETKYKFTNWTYRPVQYDVGHYASGSNINYVESIDPATARVEARGTYDLVQLAQLANRTGFSISSTGWNGCLEERTTTPASSFSPIPAEAKDLEYITGGTSPEMRWRPAIQQLSYLRRTNANATTTLHSDISDSNSDQYDPPRKPTNACPSASMRNLREYDDRASFTSYVNSLVQGGATYLDVGMVWGLRLIAPQGMFAERNLTGPNGGQISRHIIFLTDGFPDPSLSAYTAYGTELMDRRITGSNYSIATARSLHALRFQALCDAERQRVSIWAVALGTSVTGNLAACADAGRSMQANKPADLNNAFSRIANEIADLRLVE